MRNFIAPIDEEPELAPRPQQGEGQMIAMETKVGDVVQMRRGAVLFPRQPADVRRQIAEAAEMFGDEWEYRFEVKSKTGGASFIEGPTIGCTMAVARAYGNCDVAHTRTEEEPGAYVLYSTFVDLQSGFTLTRGFRQRKGQSRMGSDRGRGEDIDFQIGVSKSTRNVVARALDDYVRYAVECSRNRLVKSIEARRGEYLERIQAYLDASTYPLTAIEAALGAKMAKWSSEQIAQTVRTITAHKDGALRSLDDVYRPKAPEAEAKPSEAPEKTWQIIDSEGVVMLVATPEGAVMAIEALVEAEGEDAKPAIAYRNAELYRRVLNEAPDLVQRYNAATESQQPPGAGVSSSEARREEREVRQAAEEQPKRRREETVKGIWKGKDRTRVPMAEIRAAIQQDPVQAREDMDDRIAAMFVEELRAAGYEKTTAYAVSGEGPNWAPPTAAPIETYHLSQPGGGGSTMTALALIETLETRIATAKANLHPFPRVLMEENDATLGEIAHAHPDLAARCKSLHEQIGQHQQG